MTCTAQDQCHDVGTCNPATGTCSNPAKSNGSSCSDGNSCTQPDTCQSGSCTAGANTCASIAVTETVAEHHAQARMTAAVEADDDSVTPGDLVNFIATVTNAGTTADVSSQIDVQNTGSAAFVVQGFQQTLEYQDVVEWRLDAVRARRLRRRRQRRPGDHSVPAPVRGTVPIRRQRDLPIAAREPGRRNFDRGRR